ncbi:MAG: amino acid--tRNA ligase-related protein, partial [Candidatus Micrarchaeota archaeon]
MLRTHYADELSEKLDGQTVALAGWAHEVRDIGRLKFLLLRDRTGIVQITGKKGEVKDDVLAKMTMVKESVLRVVGKVKKEKESRRGFEITPEEIEILNPITAMIPFEVTGKVPAEIDTRLDNRYIDLRRVETQAIFRIRSDAGRAFREKLIELKFQEITPPCIVAAATEGGTDLFKVQYFEREAYLAQSPQLYKQLAVIGGMDRVFMTIPVFRAEKHHTTSHLNEVFQMDIEIGFADHNDAMDVLDAVFKHILESAKRNCADALKTLNVELKVPREIKRYTY